MIPEGPLIINTEDADVELLLEVLHNPVRRIQAPVMKSIRKLDPFRVTDVITTAIETKHFETEALIVLHWAPSTALEDAYHSFAHKAQEVLIALGAPAIAPLTQVLKERETSVAREVIHAALQVIYASIEVVGFGQQTFTESNRYTTLQNPDVSELTMPIAGLKRVLIHPETGNFHQIERFVTYAVSYIGQTHLKNHVNLHLYGDPEKLHPNIRNSLTNLCKCVHVHQEDDVIMPVSIQDRRKT